MDGNDEQRDFDEKLAATKETVEASGFGPELMEALIYSVSVTEDHATGTWNLNAEMIEAMATAANRCKYHLRCWERQQQHGATKYDPSKIDTEDDAETDAKVDETITASQYDDPMDIIEERGSANCDKTYACPDHQNVPKNLRDDHDINAQEEEDNENNLTDDEEARAALIRDPYDLKIIMAQDKIQFAKVLLNVPEPLLNAITDRLKQLHTEETTKRKSSGEYYRATLLDDSPHLVAPLCKLIFSSISKQRIMQIIAGSEAYIDTRQLSRMMEQLSGFTKMDKILRAYTGLNMALEKLDKVGQANDLVADIQRANYYHMIYMKDQELQADVGSPKAWAEIQLRSAGLKDEQNLLLPSMKKVTAARAIMYYLMGGHEKKGEYNKWVKSHQSRIQQARNVHEFVAWHPGFLAHLKVEGNLTLLKSAPPHGYISKLLDTISSLVPLRHMLQLTKNQIVDVMLKEAQFNDDNHDRFVLLHKLGRWEPFLKAGGAGDYAPLTDQPNRSF